MRTLILTVSLQMLLAAFSDGASAQMSVAGDWSVDVISRDLDYPWDLARIGERIIVTEKAGNVVHIENERQQRFKLHTAVPIRSEGGAGLLGMALSPDFAQTGIAYFYLGYRAGDAPANRAIEARFNGTAWRETRVLLADIPGHRLYNGGAIALGPDGHLYVTTGWTADRARPQDVASLAGKVLRMTLEGRAPTDNPFPGSVVYSLGHRNP